MTDTQRILSVQLVCERWPDLSEHVWVAGVFASRANMPPVKASRPEATVIAFNIVDVFEDVAMRSTVGFETVSPELGALIDTELAKTTPPV